jgi:hypothetical protein
MDDRSKSIEVTLSPDTVYAQEAAALARRLVHTGTLMVTDDERDQVPALWMADLSDALGFIAGSEAPSSLTKAGAVISALTQITLSLANLPGRDPRELDALLADHDARGVTF